MFGRSEVLVLSYLNAHVQQDPAARQLPSAMRRAQAYARIAGWQSDRPWKDGPESYMGMVEVSKALMKARFLTQLTRLSSPALSTIPVRNGVRKQDDGHRGALPPPATIVLKSWP